MADIYSRPALPNLFPTLFIYHKRDTTLTLQGTSTPSSTLFIDLYDSWILPIKLLAWLEIFIFLFFLCRYLKKFLSK